jgi:nucleoside-diphosphate-sugar epimerase
VRTVLVTGASGFIGSQLTPDLARDHRVVGLSRSPLEGPTIWIAGSFADKGHLARLPAETFDVVVHLAGVTGGCSEQDALAVNVAGTRALLRNLVDRGTERWVLASSIAATGCLDPSFVPRALPIADDHPCDATDAYGLSKHLMEQIAGYMHRRHRGLDVTVLRIGSVIPGSACVPTATDLERYRLPFAQLGAVAVADVVAGIRAAIERPAEPGFRILNLVAPWARSPWTTSASLRRLLPPHALAGLDLSYYEAPGHEFDGVWSVERAAEALGFRPLVDVADPARRNRTAGRSLRGRAG